MRLNIVQKKYLIIVTLALFLFNVLIVGTVLSRAMSETLALNEQTKQCARFWPGDEYSQYKLPSGWQAYYPNVDDYFYEVRTSFGDCIFKDSNTYTAENLQKCGQSLGFEFVDYNHFNPDFLNTLAGDYSCQNYDEQLEIQPASTTEKPYSGSLAIDKNTNKFTLLSCQIGNAGPVKKYDGLEIYGPQQQYATRIIETPAGNCTYRVNGLKDCCEQLGYNYINKDVGIKQFYPWGWFFVLSYVFLGLIIIIIIVVVVWLIARKIKKAKISNGKK